MPARGSAEVLVGRGPLRSSVPDLARRAARDRGADDRSQGDADPVHRLRGVRPGRAAGLWTVVQAPGGRHRGDRDGTEPAARRAPARARRSRPRARSGQDPVSGRGAGEGRPAACAGVCAYFRVRRSASTTRPSAGRARHRPTCPRASSWDRRCSGSPGSRSNPTIPGTRRPDRSSCCPGRWS